MVVASLLALLAADPAGVARFVGVGVSIVDAERRAPLRTGQLLERGASIVTGPEGWTEIEVVAIGRVRISAASEVALEKTGAGIEVRSGRAWILADGRSSGTVRVASFFVRLGSGHSVIVEARTGATTIVTRNKPVEVIDDGGRSVIVEPGRALDTSRGGLAEPEVGGSGLADLVAIEARRHLGDRLGVDRFLFERITEMTLGSPESPGVRRRIRSATEVAGSENAVAGGLLEEGLRVPPFFESEVPPKGPNVEVEVGFRED
jgi:hypothetical protein